MLFSAGAFLNLVEIWLRKEEAKMTIRPTCRRCVASLVTAFRLSWAMWSVFLLVVCGGCFNAQNTRFPSFQTWTPGVENEAYERQDPFPDPDIGPSLESTPRGYDRPRSESRRAAEQRMFQGLPVGPENVRPGVPQGGLKSDRAVY